LSCHTDILKIMLSQQEWQLFHRLALLACFSDSLSPLKRTLRPPEPSIRITYCRHLMQASSELENERSWMLVIARFFYNLQIWCTQSYAQSSVHNYYRGRFPMFSDYTITKSALPIYIDKLGQYPLLRCCVTHNRVCCPIYEGWNFNSGNYLFTTDTK